MIKSPQREVKAMTIGLGLTCREGVVLASDTQVTVEGYFKDDDFKLRESSVENEGALVMTYANNPTLMDLAYRKIDNLIFTSHGNRWTNLGNSISETLSGLRAQYPNEMDGQQFLFAISTPAGAPVLLRADRDVLSTPTDWECIGIGDSSLVRYLVGKFWKSSMSMEEAVLLSAYILKYAKRFIDKVGGYTHIFTVRDHGMVRCLAPMEITKIETRIDELEDIFSRALDAWTDSSAAIDFMLPTFARRLKEVRQ